MSADLTVVRTYFAKLGFQTEIADLYLALYAHGPQTISNLSRTSGVERTRIYRLIDALLDANLIEVETHYKRGIIKAAPIANLQILISKKEQELQSLQDELQLIEQVLSRDSLSSPVSRVQFYQGLDGLKQMFWNQTRAKSKTYGILHETMQHKTNSAFFERWVRVCNAKGLNFQSVVSSEFIKSLKKWNDAHQNERLENWEGRYLPASIFTIHHSTVTYDDVVAHFTWKDDQVFGIELYNKDIASTQQQLFAMLWNQGTPLSKTDVA